MLSLGPTFRRRNRASNPLIPIRGDFASPAVRIPLHTLFGIAKLDQPRFMEFQDRIVSAVRNQNALEVPELDVKESFLKHGVRELAFEQFQPERAVGELVSNAIDSVRGHPSSKKVVDIRIGKGRISVSDDGAGMDLGTVVSTLSVPYQSSKTGEGIGRFGVGFFSNLSFFKNEQAKALRLVTRTADGQSHQATYQRTTAEGPAEFEVKLQKGIKKTPGTEVHVEGVTDRAMLRDVRDELMDRFQDVQDVQIRINGKPINRRAKSRTERTYTVMHKGQPIQVRIDYDVKNGGTRLTQGGVKIQEENHSRGYRFPGRIVIDLPTSFPIGEGRRGFVMNEDYVHALAAAFGPVMQYVKTYQSRIPFLKQKRFSAFLWRNVMGTNNHTENIVHPHDAFARTATSEEIVRLHNQLEPGSMASGKPVICSRDDPDNLDRFVGRDANVVNRIEHLSSMHYPHNPNIQAAESFLTARTSQVRVMTEVEREQTGLNGEKRPEFHFIPLNADNHQPYLIWQIDGKPALLINPAHGAFHQTAASRRAMLLAYAHKELK